MAKKVKLEGFGEVLEPKLEDYLEQSKGQGLGSLITPEQDVIINENETRQL
ncbi:hypothetical protein UFOVP211_5 [uncultured Caudovirales phage]|uniref:Uncharacterized protein n=1 Tax=uncultured Caudovirales phage TaxID=2100421 RepID=A0A6J7WND5_9CAUD|nr:hypothetical protein UFOVP211_5 [uncultured Caudovirales phage]